MNKTMFLRSIAQFLNASVPVGLFVLPAAHQRERDPAVMNSYTYFGGTNETI